MNDSNNENILFNLLKQHIREEDLPMVKKLRRAERAGYTLSLINDAVRRSKIGMYNGKPYMFTGRIYEPFTNEQFLSVVQRLQIYCGMTYGDCLVWSGKSRMSAVTNLQSAELRLNPEIMVFRNGVLNLATHEFTTFSEDLIQITQVDYSYSPEAKCVQWKGFLDSVLPDPELQEVLQMFLGACFVDRKIHKIEYILILHGNGANGKSVIFNTVTGVMGIDNVTNFGIGSLIKGSERKQNIATINGKRLNYSSELQAFSVGGQSDELKALISGEPIVARQLYGANFTARDIPLIMSNTNALPQFNDFTDGMKRRLLIIPFDITIPVAKRDTMLSAKLKSEYSGVFNWILAGRDKLEKRNYKISGVDLLDRELMKIMASESTTIMFMEKMKFKKKEKMVDVDPLWYPVKLLWRLYYNWCTKNGFVPVSLAAMVSDLARGGFKIKKVAQVRKVGVYGESIIRYLTKYNYEQEVENSLTKKENMSNIWLKEVHGISKYFGLKMSVLQNYMNKGMFDKAESNENKGYYNAAKICEILDSLGLLLTDKEEMQAKSRRDKNAMAVRSMRNKFNKKMEIAGLPYRKGERGTVDELRFALVPDSVSAEDILERQEAKEVIDNINYKDKLDGEYREKVTE